MRIEPKKIGEYPWFLRLIFKKQEKKYGQALIPAMIWSRLPRLFFLIAMLLTFFERKSSSIDTVLRSLVMVKVAQLNYCKFCIDLNTMLFINKSGSIEKVEALDNWRESSLFSKIERSALEYAEAMTLSNLTVTDKMMDSLKEYFTDDEIVELTGLIAYQNLSAKFNSALDIPPQGLCNRPH